MLKREIMRAPTQPGARASVSGWVRTSVEVINAMQQGGWRIALYSTLYAIDDMVTTERACMLRLELQHDTAAVIPLLLIVQQCESANPI